MRSKRPFAVSMAVSAFGAFSLATADLPLGPGRTLYSRSDDWLAHLCVMFTILLMLRLGVSIWYAARMRRRGAAHRVIQSDVVSVDAIGPEQAPEEEEEQIYHAPARPPKSS